MGSARGPAGWCGAIALVATLAGCPAPADEPGPGPATHAALGDAPATAATGSAPAPSALASPFTAVTPSTPATRSAPATVTAAGFVSPSGNIGCYLDETGARCDINRRNWKPPPAPDDCILDWGAGIAVSKDEASFTCAGDTVLGAKDTLEYGESLRAGDFVCSSSRAAMRCENTVSRRGFTVAVERYRLF